MRRYRLQTISCEVKLRLAIGHLSIDKVDHIMQ